jgi:hypothetical protein
MSDAFAIAGVSSCLQMLLWNRLQEPEIAALVPNTRIIALPPDRAAEEAKTNPCLNLFLYDVSPNAGWSNTLLPSRNAQGQDVSNSPLAVDLHYLVTAYGKAPLETEMLLGIAMQTLHEVPGLSRSVIRQLLDPSPPDEGVRPPQKLRAKAVKLADQAEAIKIAPQRLNPEEMSKLWTGLQTNYRPSAVYLVTVVLIEGNKAVRTPLPVLTRGFGDAGPVVQASLVPPFPTLLAVRAPDYNPAARSAIPPLDDNARPPWPGDTIHLFGHHLDGASAQVVFTHTRLNSKLIVGGDGLVFTSVPLRQALMDGTERFELSDDVIRGADCRVKVDLAKAKSREGEEWAPGFYLVEFCVQRTDDTGLRTSNALPLAIAPVIRFNPNNRPEVVKADDKTTVTVQFAPAIHEGQRASLVVGDQELPVVPGAPTDPNKLGFEGVLPKKMFKPGTTHPIRLRVDGVESLFIKRSTPPQRPEFDPVQQITMP